MVYYIDNFQTTIEYQVRRRGFNPGKKTIVLAVLLSILLLLSQMFCTFNYNKPPKISLAVMHERLESLNTLVEPPPCLKNYLGSKKPQVKPPETCDHIVPPRGFCSLTQELFFGHPPETCEHQKEISFCKEIDGNIKCTLPEECRDGSIYVGHFDPDKTKWVETPFANLETSITTLSKRENFKGYLFIKCSEKTPQEVVVFDDGFQYADPIQLFMLPKISMNKERKEETNLNVNINMILIDSLSQNHFFRSLPSTVGFLDKLKDGSSHTVVDYHFVQSVKQRTYESLQVLFSGYVGISEKPFGTYSSPYYPLPLNVLLEKFKKRGYRTLWLEDLCWQWEWGLIKDLKAFNKSLSHQDLWQSFQKSLKAAMIDDLDLTLASCDILKANQVNDPFHNAYSVCFNGKYHHEFLLEYLQLYQKQMEKNGQQYFSFSQTNVAHEDTGIRVQSLDNHLVKYLEYAKHLSNTITVLFSDHGNAYGTFLQASPEAYVETFNPFLIIIIPKAVGNKIGDIKMKILRDNSQHLVTLLDVHEALLDLIKESNKNRDKEFKRRFVVPGGLFGNIPPQRTCRDLPLIQPNLCICKNFELSVLVNRNHYSLAEFSIGVLNNMILEQRRKSGRRGFGNCQLLEIKKVRSVKELRRSADVVQYKIDVEATGVTDTSSEYFFFIVEVGEVEPPIRLVSFERNSAYGSYEACRDPNVDLKLCFCRKHSEGKGWNFAKIFSFEFLISSLLNHDKEEEFSLKQIQAFYSGTSSSSTSSVEEKYPTRNPCLYIMKHKYENSFNIFGVNLCNSLHKVTLEFVTDNFYLSEKPRSSYLLRYLDVKLLIGGTNANLKTEGTYDYNIIII